jgi:two-component system OmpR family response regulator
MIQTPKSDGICVLIAEDDDEIRDLLLNQFKSEPYVLRVANTLAAVRKEVAARHIDVLTLDLNFPDGDGLELCKQLRAEGYEGAIIMVTARDSALDRVLGLEFGANDYVAKPFEPRELLLRVRNLVKALNCAGVGAGAGVAPRPQARVARFGPWRLDLHQRRLLAHDDRLVMLSSSEYRLLTLFIEAPDKVLSRDDLVDDKKKGAPIDRRTIDLQISRLRQKLAVEKDGQSAILTVRNEGYLMPGPVIFE